MSSVGASGRLAWEYLQQRKQSNNGRDREKIERQGSSVGASGSGGNTCNGEKSK
jgi:hypothetical protein